MPALNFLKVNVPKIESGEKPHTIRRLGKRQFKVGDRLYLYWGQRTKSCQKIGETNCIKVDSIRIYGDTKEIILNGKLLEPEQIAKLAIRDGFQDTMDFFEFFSRYSDFDGQVIWWNPKEIR